MFTYEDLLKEVEIRIRDLCVSIRELERISEGDEEKAKMTFIKCQMMLKAMVEKSEGFKQLLECSLP